MKIGTICAKLESALERLESRHDNDCREVKILLQKGLWVAPQKKAELFAERQEIIDASKSLEALCRAAGDCGHEDMGGWIDEIRDVLHDMPTRAIDALSFGLGSALARADALGKNIDERFCDLVADECITRGKTSPAEHALEAKTGAYADAAEKSAESRKFDSFFLG